IDYKEEKPWSYLKKISKTTNVCAVPFKRKVFAIGTLTDISNAFKGVLKSDIKREPISRYDVENVSAFKSLMLQAILKHFAIDERILTNYKNKIWLTSNESEYQKIKIHKALFLSFYFDKNKHFGYLTFTPTLHLAS